MARQPRLEISNGIYHVTVRGNVRSRIFHDENDRMAFLNVLSKALDRYSWSCLAYCLMGNHFHLVVRTPVPNFARGMQYLNGVYAQKFNRSHKRCGHVQQGRYGAALVEDDPYMLEVIRYVARNPVRGRLCQRPEDWRWSSHREVLGLAPPRLVALAEVLALFGNTQVIAREQYRAFVDNAETIWSSGSGKVVIGSEEFRELNLARVSPSTEFSRSSLQHRSLEELLTHDDRDAAIASAHLEHHYSQAQIARALGCHYSTVSRRLKAWEMQEDARFKI